MNDHPEGLLAEYVDGSLAAHDRARVEAHLASCSTCAEEVAVAGRARTALTGLPDVPVPFGTEERVLRHTQRRSRWSSPLAWRTAGLAAAAAAIVGAVVYVTGPGTRRDAAPVGAPQRAPAGAEDQGAAEPPLPAPAEGPLSAADAAFPHYSESGTNHTSGTLTAAARRFASDAEVALAEGFPPTARDFYGGYDLRRLDQPAQDALTCVNRGVPPDRTVVPFVVEAAEFEERPAYLVAYLRGTDPETPYDRIQVVVVDRESCGVLHFARQNL